MRDHPEFILVDIPELKDFQTRNSAEPDAAERAAAARCCRYVQVALQRFEAMCATPDPEFAEPTASDLAEASGKNVRRCELQARNWRHRLYFVEFEDGTLAIAKQSTMDSDAMLRFQYEQLRQLAKLNMRLLIRSRLRKTGFGISLSRNGKRSTVVGVPGTCPPRPLNGLLITDFLTPDTNCEYTYPGELKAEIERLVGEYIVDVRDFRSGEQIRASHPRFTTAK